MVSVTWPLVGRDEEVGFLADTLEAGASAGCVLSGSAGVGKTRLALEVAERARAAGRDVEWLVSTPGTQGIALGALAPALGEPPPVVSESELLHWARKQIAARPTLVLCVDDAHLLDDMSASILLQLAARQETFVVATTRSGEDCPEGVVGLWKDGWAERVEVLPLGREETAELARDLLGAEVTEPTVDRLFTLSGGVPLYLRELLVAGVEEGSIVDAADGRKHWQGPVVPTARLSELVNARLGRLVDEQRDGLLAVALGHPLDLRIAERLVAGNVLAALEERGLVATERGEDRPVARVSHPLYSEVLRESLPATASRAMFRRLAEAADEVGYPDDNLLRVATWRLECGDLGDPERLLAAGDRALRLSDTDLAARLGRAATESGAGPQGQLLASRAYWFANPPRFDEAAAALDALAVADLDDDTRAQAARLRSYLLLWGSGDPGAAHDLLAATAPQIRDPAQRAEVDGERIWPLVVSDRFDEAAEVAAPYMSEDWPHASATVRALPPAVLASAIRGRTGDALRFAERGAGLVAETAEAPSVLGALLSATCMALWLDGRVLDAEELARSAYAGDAEGWSDSGRGLFGFVEGKAALERGHAERAVDLLKPAVDALRSDDVGNLLSWALYSLARAEALRGDAAAAKRALAAGDEARRPAIRLDEPDRTFATAAIYEEAEPGAGRRTLAEASLAFESRGALAYALLATMGAVRLGSRARSDVERASELADRCQGTFAPTVATFVHGAVQRDASELNAVAGELEQVGIDLFAAEAALLAAGAFEREGRHGTALGARQTAERILERCGPVRAPIVTASLADSPLTRLTSRELEVAQLVATGLTNRQIAERLYVSERTVDNHVQNVFGKLGINRRGDLAVLA